MKGELVAPTKMRAGIARRMTESKQSIPHFYVETEVLLDETLVLLKDANATAPSAERVTMTAAIVRASAEALVARPAFNSVWTADGLVIADEVNVSVAIALEGGLVAPAVRAADELGLADTSTVLRDLGARARENRLRPAELTDGTFTVSNLGMFQVSAFTAIVTSPQVGIIATGRPRDCVVLVDEVPTTRSVMTATLSADHRAVDGVDAARFLEAFKNALEHPATLAAPARSRQAVA